MNNYKLYSVFMILFLMIFQPLRVDALESPHGDLNGISCFRCHTITQQAGKLVITVARSPSEQEAQCKSCHYPQGQASGMYNVGNHWIHDGTEEIQCATCHNPHAYELSTDNHTLETDYNLKLIRSSISRLRVPGVLNPVIYHQFDQMAFEEGNAPYNGVCQACHTQTLSHRNDDSSDHQHRMNFVCTACHRHEAGFPSISYSHTPQPVNCVECHAPSRPAEPHPQTGDCSECHTENIGVTWLGAAYSHDPVPESCRECHADERPAEPHPQTPDCVVCHTDPGGSWLTVVYSHDPVPGECAACHDSDRPEEPHPPAGECADCHTDVGLSWQSDGYTHSPVPSSCNACHSDERPLIPHPQDRDCAECHLEPGVTWLGAHYDHLPVPTTCIECHEADRPTFQHPQQQDCNACHSDPGGTWMGFAGCNLCHGNPPVADTPGGTDGLVGSPAATGSLSSGSHEIHATPLGAGYACETCHSGGMPETPINGNQRIQIGFDLFGISGAGTAYDGRELSPPYQYEGTNGTVITDNGTLSCSNLYCHGMLADGTSWGGGSNTTPQWGEMLYCGDCHRADADNPPLTGSHETHAGSAGAALACETCHSAYPAGHVNGRSDFSFSGDPLVSGGTYSGTPAMLDAYGRCSNLYCHSNVQNDNATGGPTAYAAPVWGEQLDCGSCHANPPDTGSHAIHYYSVNYHTGFGTVWDCTQCHSTGTHVDGSIDVGRGYTQSGAPANGYGTCSSNCHTGAVWGGERLYCYDCHGANNGCYECHPLMLTHARADNDPAVPLPVQDVPALIPEPDMLADNATAVTLEWNPVPPASGGVSQYEAELSVNPDMSYPLHKLSWTAAENWTPILEPSRLWYWRVRSRDIARPGLVSGWSQTDQFYISLPGTPVAPVLIPEPDILGAPDVLLPVTLECHPVAFEDPVEYRLEVSLNRQFTSLTFASDWSDNTSRTFVPPFCTPYWWRVKARNALEPSRESAWSFEDEFRIWSPSGSCPFLYVWDGQKFAFQTDLYGPGKLGTQSSRGYLTPNPNDYYVLAAVPEPLDGEYRMRLVEERYETDYLDELKLYVLDVPMNREVYAEKPGFGGTLDDLQDVLHTASQVRQPILSVVHVNTGADAGDLVRNADGSFLVLNKDRNIDFNYQTLELDLGDLAGAPQIKLIIDGQSAFPDSPEGTERAALFGPRTKLEVLNAGGQWVSVPKTTAELPKLPEFKRMFALDISNIFLTDTYKVRLTFLFKTFVDAIYLDTTADQPVSLMEVPLLSAELRSYGLSEEVYVFQDIFNYRYRTGNLNHYHAYFPGSYTRYGDVTPLLSGTDDMFVIYGQGDELDLRFSSAFAPPLPGKKRSFLMYTNGYYKDVKVNVPHMVEPLPFAAMSGFPYDPAVENYPDDAAHNEYRQLYNTRAE